MNSSLIQQDYGRRFLFASANVRGELIRLRSAWSELQARAHFPAAVAPWVAHAVVGNALAASTIKFDGQLSLQIQSEGPIRFLVAQCSSHRTVRAMAQYGDSLDAAPLSVSAGLAEAFGSGTLALTLARSDEGEDYNGVVALEGRDLAEALAFYFAQSEQLQTRFFFGFDGQEVVGLLLQRLPGEAEDADGWNRIELLASTVTEPELLAGDDTGLLQRLFAEESIELFEPKNLTYACVCSRERTQRMIVGLGQPEAQSIVDEQGQIEVTCEFCRKAYTFTQSDVDGLFAGGSEGANALH